MHELQMYIERVWDVDLENWIRGDTLCLQTKGAARPWVLRDCKFKSIAIFPDNSQALDFYFDWKALFGEREIVYLPELPLTADQVGQSALWVSRGELYRKWRHDEGYKLLIAS